MSIVSISFFILLIVSLFLYYVLPKCCQWIILLITSLVFFCFACTPWTIVYLLVGIFVTWLAAQRIHAIRQNPEKHSQKALAIKPKLWLILALVIDLGMLVALKYMNFILGNASLIFNLFSKTKVEWSVNWPAALGISYYTLQIVGYLLDCYWGIITPQKNIAKFALFSCFFAQMTSGPISRYEQLGGELEKPHKFDAKNIYLGTIRISVGLIKKIVLADGLAAIASIFSGPESTFLALLLYVIRIYSDFSGCMDIALGAAKCFGVDMVENFKTPFLSRSIQEFWQRWHITLGLWLRDYIMYPILRTKTWSKLTKFVKSKIGKRASKLIPTHLAMLILWFFMGLWHGGGWTFILEGIWFWLVIVIGEWCLPLIKKFRSKFDTENPGWVLFQRGRTVLIYAVGALLFKSVSISSAFSDLFTIFSTYQFYTIALTFALFCVLAGTLHNAIKNQPKAKIAYASTLSAILVPIAALTIVLVAGFILVKFSVGDLTSFCVIVLIYMLFMLFVHFESKDGGIGPRTLSRPIVYKIMLILFFFFLALVFGFYKSGYDPADFIYGGF